MPIQGAQLSKCRISLANTFSKKKMLVNISKENTVKNTQTSTEASRPIQDIRYAMIF